MRKSPYKYGGKRERKEASTIVLLTMKTGAIREHSNLGKRQNPEPSISEDSKECDLDPSLREVFCEF